MTDIARILLIDDDASIRRTISKALEKAGYKVDTAENGKEALEKVRANFYNLALIDIRLPDMDGTKLLTSMKDTTPKMIKIILTGHPALENAIDAVNKGADAYVTKPVKIAELQKVIKERLEKQVKDNEFDEQKINEFVQTRLKRLETEEKDKERK
jgi:DNA-binding NtrC family response regulator